MRVRQRNRFAAIAAIMTLVPIGLCAVAAPAQAAGPTCATHVASDFNGDGYADLATGAFGRTVGGQDGAGSVQIDYGSKSGIVAAKSQYFDQTSAGMPTSPEFQAFFGFALASGYFNNDCYADLAIGVPGANNSDGAVIVLHGSAKGLTTTGAQLIDSPDSAADFGDALAAGDFNGDGLDDLAVGESSIAQVRIFNGGSTLPTSSTAFTEFTFGMPGTGQGGDQFGTALTAGDFNGDGDVDLAIGAPNKKDGSADEAGAVYALQGSPEGLTTTGARLLNQSTSGISGVSESGDHFGNALAAGDVNNDGKADLIVGTPGEAIGTVKTAGDVAYIPGTTSGPTGAGTKRFSESTAGVPGTIGTGDDMGAFLAVGDFTGDGHADIAIGVPGDAVGSVEDAGTVIVLKGAGTGPTTTGAALFSQATPGVDGTPESVDLFGDNVHAAYLNGGKDADLVVGARLESSGTTTANGYADVLRGTSGGVTGTGSHLIAQSGPGDGNDADFGWSFG